MSREWPLLGRSEELRMVAAATRSDRTRGMVISGPAGVGKTRIAREAVAAAGPRSVLRHWIGGTDSARHIPLGAFVNVASTFGPDPLRRVREVIAGLIGDADRAAVVVCVDDAHLLDDLSAFTVHQLVTRRLATVILTIRSGVPVPDAITALWKDQYLDRLELQPLSLDEIRELVEHVLDGPVHSRCAQRLWQYTQGNALHLRHLLDSEISAGRITRQADVWVWEGQPRMASSLTDVIETRIGQVAQPVRDVLDALAVTEPLDIDMLGGLTGIDAVTEAEFLGLVRVDVSVAPAAVRLAHPLLGEVRRTGSAQMRALYGRIATALAHHHSADPRDLVRCAALALQSDLAPDPDLLNAATAAAIQLTDMRLAASLAEHAEAAGGGLQAQIAHATALMWQERGEATEIVLAALAKATSGPLRVQIALLRALNLTLILGKLGRAEAELAAAVPAGDPAADAAVAATVEALRASIDIARGHPHAAVERARTVLDDESSDAIARILAIWVLVSGLGELGRISAVDAVADLGYTLADTAAEVSHLRLALAFLHAYMLRLAGALSGADTVIARIRHDTVDVPIDGSWQVAESWHAFVSGLSAVSRGDLTEARRLCQESLADFGGDDSISTRRAFARCWLAGIAGMSGQAVTARRELGAVTWWPADPDACARDPERSIAQAWVLAAEDAVPEAISLLREAAAQLCAMQRPGWEVLFLQIATQFGDRSTATRLTELAGAVEGPRAPVAAAHAVALAAHDGDGLLAAAADYEAFGDRVAAADAAAQAALAYQNAGRRGSALGASATAGRLAAQCGGAHTPALRAGTLPIPITARQREIIYLAGQGFSNQEIADQLVMSVRSVQGHLFRASQRLGVRGRDELAAIVAEATDTSP